MKETTHKAISICHKLGKPSEINRKVLSSLYPSSSIKNVTFDPVKQSIAEKQKMKKKAAIPKKGIKMRLITTVLLEDHKVIPRGHVRKRLATKGCIQKLKIHRNMNTAEVKKAISDCYPNLDVAKIGYLKCEKDSSLTLRKDQALNGNDVADIVGSSGSLYLAQVIGDCWCV